MREEWEGGREGEEEGWSKVREEGEGGGGGRRGREEGGASPPNFRTP